MRQLEGVGGHRPQVRIQNGRLEWEGRVYPVAEPTVSEPNRLLRVRNTIVLLTVFLYLLLNWGFQQVRFPPTAGSGLPIGELVLLLALVTLNPNRVLGCLSREIYLLPLLLWWVFGVGRALVDISVHGFWTLRDAAHVIESLYLIVGFAFALRASALEKFYHWLPRLLAIAAVYGLLYSYRHIFLLISPHIISANGYSVPIVGSMANTSLLLILVAFYLFLYKSKNVICLIYAAVLIGYTLAMFQQRTLYLVMIAIMGFLWLLGRFRLIHLLMAAALLGGMLAVIMLLDLRVHGRLGETLSPEFLVHHFLAIFGLSSSEFEGVAAAAAGVDQRLGWWSKIFGQLLSDPFNMLLGLGYGIALTDFYGSGGAAVREPHNSYITTVARTGLIGIACWVLMMASMVHRWLLTFRRCRALGYREGENRLLILMVYFICVWVLALGEDGFEKPYNIIPFYFFWGVVLGLGHLLTRGEINVAAKQELEIPSERWLSGRRPENYA
jgi:hypothetical protein